MANLGSKKYSWADWLGHILISLYLLAIVTYISQLLTAFFKNPQLGSVSSAGSVAVAFGVLGGVSYCLVSLFKHWCKEGSWNNNWIFWYILYPMIGGVAGLLSFILLAIVIPDYHEVNGKINAYLMLLPAVPAFLAGFKSRPYLESLQNIKETSQIDSLNQVGGNSIPINSKREQNDSKVYYLNYIEKENASFAHYAKSFFSKKQITKKGKGSIVRDAIHGDIEIPDYVKAILKVDSFQRLRNIRQTGLAYLVFPCMQHSRFEHSLGTFHIACRIFDNLIQRIEEKSFLEKLKKANINIGNAEILVNETIEALEELTKIEVQERWRKIFTLSALLHDIGHGPFSHTFEHLGVVDSKEILKTLTLNASAIRESLI